MSSRLLTGRPTIYDSLGVRPIINGTGTFTRLGGTLMPPEVVAAMAEAAKHFVVMEELQVAAGRVIAEVTGAEAGYVTSGAQAALVLAIAACITGTDPAKMDRMPHSDGLANQVIIARVHRNNYDHAIETGGGRLVEVGAADRVTPADYAAAITDRTAAILFLPWNVGGIELADVAAVARQHHIPLIVDGSGRLDEPDNLRAFIRNGADIAVFSGGKFIRGPQASGFAAGRRNLIEAMAWQHLDMDVTPAVWGPPAELLNVAAMPFIPRQGIGRGYKAGKEEIVGLITALRLFVKRDHAAERMRHEALLHTLIAMLDPTPHLHAEFVAADTLQRGLPLARIRIAEDQLGMDAYAFTLALKLGTPSIHPLERELAQGALLFSPFSLTEGDVEWIAARCNEIVAEQMGRTVIAAR
jgi:D-glucosaminate-6-phosphate ammonia-lyase